MVLKKQTVWLLTMLSLIVVLSVYYVTTPGGNPQEVANVNNKAKQAAKENGLTASSIATDQLAAYSLERDQVRHDQVAKLEAQIAAKDATAVEVSKAQDELEAINNLESKEKMVEDMIMSKGYNDAVVDATHDGQVNVYVQADSLSNEQANEIIKMVIDQLGISDVRVTYEPSKTK